MDKETPQLNVFLEFFPFKDGEIGVKLTKPQFSDQICSSFQVSKGSFQCTNPDCEKVFNVGDSVLPVFWKKELSNFVCIYCRGLLKNIPQLA